MDRRHFLRTSSAATIGGFTVQGFSSPLMQALWKSRSAEDRVLVIVQLYGGNDGLNTVIPLDQYGVLATKRPYVLIPQVQVLPLAGLGGTGLHPSMTGFQDLWLDGKLAIVQGVGYPEPNYSHFRATDIYETGANADQLLNSGWTGRYLNYEYPNYPAGYPNDDMPDPLAIRVGGAVGPGLQFQGVSMGVSINNTSDPLNLAGNIYQDPVTAACSGGELDFVRQVQRQTDLYSDVIEAAATSGCNQSTLYPTGNEPGELHIDTFPHGERYMRIASHVDGREPLRGQCGCPGPIRKNPGPERSTPFIILIVSLSSRWRAIRKYVSMWPTSKWKSLLSMS